MRISVLGLGYVGAVTATCLADLGNEVIGVDVDATKTDLINSGKSPVIEPMLDGITAEVVAKGLLRATIDEREAVLSTDLTLICVGTPGAQNGQIDLGYVTRVAEQIGEALKEKPGYHLVALRSTVIPGTAEGILIPALERTSGKQAGVDFGVAVNPEFMREGSAVDDFREPSKTVVGELDERSGKLLDEMYSPIDKAVHHVALEVAEMIKYVDNSWHATKIAFANEMGNIAKSLGVDSNALIDLFMADTKLNISRAYLRPGFAFGGSCLPKDLRAITYLARSMDLDTPLLSSVLPSNEMQLKRGISLITGTGAKKIGILGLSFKAGTDDLRESPMVELVEFLIGKGYEIQIFDPNVNMARVVGANREYILEAIPHVSRLMVEDPAQLLEDSEVIVVGTNDPLYTDVVASMKPDQQVIDLVRLSQDRDTNAKYVGIAW